jgi:alpha-L-fucosidase
MICKFNYREFPLNKMLPEMKELIETFKPHVLWSDGDWEALPEYFGSEDFLAWLYNDSPVKDTIVTNDR